MERKHATSRWFPNNRGVARSTSIARLIRVNRNDRLSVVIALGRKTSPSGLRSGPELTSHGADTIQEVKSVLPSSRGVVTRRLSRTFPPFEICALNRNFQPSRRINQMTDCDDFLEDARIVHRAGSRRYSGSFGKLCKIVRLQREIIVSDIFAFADWM